LWGIFNEGGRLCMRGTEYFWILLLSFFDNSISSHVIFPSTSFFSESLSSSFDSSDMQFIEERLPNLEYSWILLKLLSNYFFFSLWFWEYLFGNKFVVVFRVEKCLIAAILTDFICLIVRIIGAAALRMVLLFIFSCAAPLNSMIPLTAGFGGSFKISLWFSFAFSLLASIKMGNCIFSSNKPYSFSLPSSFSSYFIFFYSKWT